MDVRESAYRNIGEACMIITVTDIFGLIVRSLGLWSLFRAFAEGLVALEFQVGIQSATGIYSASRYAAAGGVYLVLGLSLVVLAGPITRLVYRGDK